ncbi:UNKNOWN [Stylonychia lemnae]|uniref:Morn repeat protein n=1 Tax=Stylonychia lemnae TaxID=5949 RepID=A0A078AUP2_STYLE|nr:UNKNOWN [Stylonychia lemnae]|eukprot:CDW85894.1 UNKNOWN [Stylonychia lemnae]
MGTVLIKRRRKVSRYETLSIINNSQFLSIGSDGKKLYANEYKDCLPCGNVKLLMNEQLLFEGTYENVLPHGQGIQIDSNNGKYVGNFRKGIREGYGLYYYSKDNFFAGMYKDNMQNGLGYKRFSQGQIIIGQCKENKFNGECQFFILKESDEKKINTNLKIWLLSFKPVEEQLMPESILEIFDTNQPYYLKYSGQFVDDELTGQGELMNDRGEKWVGQFTQFLQNGICTYYKDDKMIYKGVWIMVELQDEIEA